MSYKKALNVIGNEGCNANIETVTIPKKKDNSFLKSMRDHVYIPTKQWFSTDKPLPDGDYGWRNSKGDKPLLFSVKNGNIYQGHVMVNGLVYIGKAWLRVDFNIGEWFKIEFSD